MKFKESVGNFLNEVQNELKVDNTIFTVRHGFPRQLNGKWNSKDDYFQLSSTFGVFYNIGLILRLSPDLVIYTLFK